MINALNNEINKLIEYKKTSNNQTVKKAVSKAISYIRDEINTIKTREWNSKHCLSVDVNDKLIKIPSGMNIGMDGREWFVDNGSIYAIGKKGWDDDGSFHFHCYVWLKDGDKYVRLTIRALGADRFGDRLFVEANFYKTENDSYSYLTKHVNPKGKYKEYINETIFKLREKEGLENFFKM
jgi:hypothetical protein